MSRLIFAASTFVTLGSPRHCPRALPRAETAAHESAVKFVQRRALQFVRLMETGGAIGTGRRGPALLAQLDQLRREARSLQHGFDPYGLCSGSDRLEKMKDAGSAILPVVADRISLPSQGATCALQQWLPESVAETYIDPERLRVSGALSSRSKVHATRENWIALLRRFDAAGMLVLAPEGEIPRDACGRVPRNGFFAVFKDADTDRTVCS